MGWTFYHDYSILRGSGLLSAVLEGFENSQIIKLWRFDNFSQVRSLEKFGLAEMYNTDLVLFNLLYRLNSWKFDNLQAPLKYKVLKGFGDGILLAIDLQVFERMLWTLVKIW